MRRLILLLIVCSSLYATITGPVHQATGSVSNNTTFSVTITAPASGNALVACVVGSSTAGISSISGGGVTWAKVNGSAVQRDAEVWVGLNSSGSGTSISFTAARNDYSVNISEWSGIATSSATDQSTTNSGSGTNNPTTGTINTTNANDLLIGCANEVTASISSGPTNSFTGLTTGPSVSSASAISAYQIVSATGAYSTGWTLSTTVKWDAVIISLKASGSPPPPATAHQLLTLGVG